MELTQFEQDLGLADVKGCIVVGANIWAKKGGNRIFVSVDTTRRAFHQAVMSDTRYSMDKTLDLIAKGNKSEGLKALVYRAKVSDKKGLAIRDKEAVHLGIMQR
jgi:hypothetical protein